MAYLDDTGLAYFWGKIKAWAQGLFALIGHTHAASDVTAMTGYSKPASGSAVAASDTLNQAVGKLEAKVDAIDDSNYVHKTGDESIDGYKLFLNYVRSMSSFSAKRTYFADDIHVSSYTFGTLVDIVDRDANSLAELYYGQAPNDDTVFVLRSRSKDRNSAGYVTLRHNESSGVFVLEIPTPPADSNTNHAASTSWVRSLLASDTGVVHTTGDETISGYKVFNNNVESWGDFHTISNLFDGATVYNDNRYQSCINVRDKNSSVMADSYYGRTGGANGSTVWAFRLYSPDKSKAGYLQLFYWPSSDTFTVTVPTPPSTSNSSDVPTTAWVRTFGNNTYLPLAGGTMTGAINYKVSYTRGTAPSSWQETGYYISDSAGNRLLALTNGYATDKSSMNALYAYNTTVASGTNIGSIGIGCTASGTVYTKAPTPATSDNSTQIATTAFVKAQGYITSFTDTKVTQSVSTSNNTYPLLLCPTANATTNQGEKTAIFAKSVKVNASTNELYATKLHAANVKDLSSNGLYDTTNTGTLFVCGGSSISTSSHINISGYQNTGSATFLLRASSPSTVSPSTYSDLSLGYAGTLKWKGQTVQTSSDERLKTPISSVDDGVLDAWADVSWGQFKFLDAVEEKGDNARFHVGLIAQGVDRTCIAKNVDICKYGILCHDEWEDEYIEEDGKQVLYNKAGDIWMVRYTEALCMEAAYMRRENARLKKRVADLEDRLAALELRLGSE